MAKRRNPYTRDARTKRAKAEGYPARSVYKLEEIDRRVKLFRGGQRVLDLGAAPGSWTLYAAQKVSTEGRVVAIDLQTFEPGAGPHVSIHRGDALEESSEAVQSQAPYDVVLSDMAPRTTGYKDADRALSFELFAGALEIACRLLVPGGSFVGKLFMSGDFEEARDRVRAAFETCKVIRPKGTRDNSTELFLVGLKRRVPGSDDAR